MAATGAALGALRVLDPKAGVLESRDGRRTNMSPRTQVMVQICESKG